MNYMLLGLTLCLPTSTVIFSSDKKKQDEIQFPQGNLVCGKLLAEAIKSARNEKQITEFLEKKGCSRGEADYGAFNLATQGLSHEQKWLAWQVATRNGTNDYEFRHKVYWPTVTAVAGLAMWATAWYFSENLTEAKRIFRSKPTIKPKPE